MPPDLRHQLWRLGAEHGLDADQARRLHALAGLGAEPPALARRLPLGLMALAAALLGIAVVMWVAANWQDFGRSGRFALLQGLVVLTALGAAFRPAWRAPLGLLCLLGIGALFAYFGQTYQTGADAWQLFALWAALALPLALAVRSDLLWAPWALVASLAVSLWVGARIGFGWRDATDDLRVQLCGLGLLLALNLALGAPLARWSGAGLWARRSIAVLTLLNVVPVALAALFASEVRSLFALGLLLLGLAAALLSTRRGFDVFTLSAVALGLDVLLLAGLARLLFRAGEHSEPIALMLLMTLAAVGLLAASVKWIMALVRRAEAQS